LENEKFLNDRRLKINIFRHFKYFGPRGELFFFAFLLFVANRQIKNNLKREHLEDHFNDSNTFLQIRLPAEKRAIIVPEKK
jgi:hypothetical protein